MTRQRATESEVASLHGQLNDLYKKTAETLATALESDDEETRLMAINLTSPALLTSMANWVKMNNVTCQPEDVQSTQDLADKLRNKRQEAKTRREKFTLIKLRDISPDEEAVHG